MLPLQLYTGLMQTSGDLNGAVIVALCVLLAGGRMEGWGVIYGSFFSPSRSFLLNTGGKKK